jgi:methylenetetrahydrofolate dehydrogenase (NADP+)/methenyltetrahydrofolate cyclohydrolase
VVLVGNNEASTIYVKKKLEACKSVGIECVIHHYVATEEEKVLDRIKTLNKYSSCNGILVQLPLPIGFDNNRIFDMIDPLKDVDVFHPENVGLLVQNRPRFLPPTPHAVREIVKSVTNLVGKHVVVINRSNIVGKPLSSMLIQDNGEYANATVTVCHDKTSPAQLKAICLTADIIVVAVGIPNFLTPDMVNENQIIVDVGINRLENKIVGDVHPFVAEHVAYITPVPGGVGPVTVAMLLYNTVEAVRLQNAK